MKEAIGEEFMRLCRLRMQKYGETEDQACEWLKINTLSLCEENSKVRLIPLTAHEILTSLESKI